MNRIKILAKEISDKIAAGEVIESPLSAVKELVENSVDAGATQVVVEIKDGGREYIRVSDNGSGIEKDDLKLAVYPHATSKIRFAEDLENVTSLGFRGEALASIAAVSRLEILSKTDEDKTGRKLTIEASEIKGEEEAACETGTTCIVRDLFFNLPARQKFLKSNTKESASISEFVSRMALAYPDIRFRFINDGTIRFSTPGRGDIYQTILTVYSPQNARKLLKLSYSNTFLTIKGYVSSPLESRNNRKQQVYFVNGRLISSSLLENAVKAAYSDKLFEGRYPSVYLFMEIDPSMIDVNVHPRKAEIKFSDEQSVFDFTVAAIREALLDREAASVESEDISIKQFSTFTEDIIQENAGAPVYAPQPKEETVSETPEAYKLFETLRKDTQTVQEVIPEVKEEFKVPESSRLKFSSLKPLCQAFATYILAEDENALYVIDQHAAHERIMYEKFLKSFNSAERSSQMIMTPVIIELDRSKAPLAEESLPMLYEMGFAVEIFGDSSYLVKEIPYFLDLSEAEDFLYEFFDAAGETGADLQLKRDSIISKACKSAVKAHDILSKEEMKALFTELDGCENPYSCPHGRPTFIKFSEYELERMFKRK